MREIDAEIERIKQTRRLSDEDIEEIRRLRESGYSYEKIAQMTGFSPTTVRKYASSIPMYASPESIGRVPSQRVIGEITSEVTKEVVDKHKEMMEYARGSYAKASYYAKQRGMSPADYVQLCIDFYEAYSKYVKELERQNEELKQMVEAMREYEPNVFRERMFWNYMLMCSYYGIKPDRRMMEVLFHG